MKKKLDRIRIEGLGIYTVIGINEWERQTRQQVILDVEMSWDISEAARSDDINHTLNYKEVAKRLTSLVEASDYGLIEKLAEHCAQVIRDEFDVPWLRLKVSKPGAVRGADNVAVIIERGRPS